MANWRQEISFSMGRSNRSARMHRVVSSNVCFLDQDAVLGTMQFLCDWKQHKILYCESGKA